MCQNWLSMEQCGCLNLMIIKTVVGKELLCVYKVILHLCVRFCFVYLLHAYKCGRIKIMLCVQCI